MSLLNKQSPLGLLDLPPEIRVEILQHLLVSPKPIQTRSKVGWLQQTHNFLPPYPRSNPSWHVSPVCERPTSQILQTCRRLYEEGVELLYRDNTFAVTLLVGNELVISETFDFLGFDSLHDAFAKSPRLRHVSKYIIDVHIDHAFQEKFFEPKGYHPVERVVEQMRYLCPPRLEYLQANLTYEGSYPFKNDVSKKMLYDLGLLRAHTANFSHLPESFASPLADLVMSSRPVVNLKLAFGQATVDSRQHGNWNSWGAFLRHRLLMLSAILDWDVDRFETLKNSINFLSPAEDVSDFERRFDTVKIRSKSF